MNSHLPPRREIAEALGAHVISGREPRSLIGGDDDFERAWLRDLTMDHLRPPRNAAEARNLSALFDRVSLSEALHAISQHPGQRLTSGDAGERVEAVFDDRARIVWCTYALTAKDGWTATWSIGQLFLDVGSGALWPGDGPDSVDIGELAGIEGLLADVYRQAVGDHLVAVLLDIDEYAWRLHLLGQHLDADRPALMRQEPSVEEDLRAHGCRVAVHLFAEPGSELRAVAERIVSTWTGSAPDLLAASRDVLAW